MTGDEEPGAQGLHRAVGESEKVPGGQGVQEEAPPCSELITVMAHTRAMSVCSFPPVALAGISASESSPSPSSSGWRPGLFESL